MGSMNMPGLSISLLNLTNVADECSSIVDVAKLLTFLDAPHLTSAWPATENIYPLPEKLKGRKREDAFTEVEKEEKKTVTDGPKLLGESTCHTGIKH